MYKTEKVVVEDMRFGKNSLEETKYFTGGECRLSLPVTISFMGTGDYRVHIDEGRVTVSNVEKDSLYD